MFKAKAISTYVYGIFAYDIPQGIAIYDFFGGKHHFKFFNMQLRTVAVKQSSDFTRNLDEIIADFWSEIVTVEERYEFRNLPCNIVPKNQLWCVSGVYEDKKKNMSGGGILEWCYNEEDANITLSQMKRDKRFSKLSASKYIKEIAENSEEFLEI